jgi:hypothetical protein
MAQLPVKASITSPLISECACVTFHKLTLLFAFDVKFMTSAISNFKSAVVVRQSVLMPTDLSSFGYDPSGNLKKVAASRDLSDATSAFFSLVF